MHTDNLETALYRTVTHLTFTGTRNGMTDKQRQSFRWLLHQFPSLQVFVHGDCVGADADAHNIVLQVLPEDCIWKFPSNHSTRAFTKGGVLADEPKHPLDRNITMVNKGNGLVACPKGYKEELRSGTWHAVRNARRSDKLIWIIWPDGSLTCPWD